MHKRFKKYILGCFFTALLCCAAWFGGLYWLGQEIEGKHPEIQEYLHQKIGIPLQYDSIETQLHLTGVSFSLNNLVINHVTHDHVTNAKNATNTKNTSNTANAENSPLLSMQKLELYPDLIHSLLERKIILKDIVVHGLKTQYHWDEKKQTSSAKANTHSISNANSKSGGPLDLDFKAVLAAFASQQKISLKEAEIVWTGKFGQIIQRLDGQFAWVSRDAQSFQFQGSQALKFNEGEFFNESPLAFTFNPNTEQAYIKTGLGNAVLECDVDREKGLDCVIKADQLNLAQMHQNLMLKEINTGWVTWLIQAVSSGYADGQAHITGMPGSLDWKGNFRFNKVNMKYAKDWPGIEKAKGTVKIEKHEITVHADSGNVLETPFNKTKVVIAPVATGSEKPTVVSVESHFSGRLEQGMEFLKQSPLQNIYQRLLTLKPQGPMTLALNLKIPIKNSEKAKTEILGHVTVKQAKLWVPELELPIEQLHGNFEFTDKGLTTKTPAQGEFLKRPVMIEAKGPEGIMAKTYLTTEFLQEKFPNSLLQRLKGASEVELHIPNDNDHWTLTSKLQGIEIDLPQPFGKPRDEIRPITVTLKKAKNEILYAFDTELSNAQFSKTKLSYDSREPNTWYLEGPMLSGGVTLPSNTNKNNSSNANVLKINLERLNIPGEEERKQVTGKFLNSDDKVGVVFVCKSLSIGGKNIGQVNFTLEPNPSGYNIKSLTAASQAFQLEAFGEWRFKGSEGSKAGTASTAIRGQLTSHNMGAAFSQLGFSSAIASGSGKIKFDMQWGNNPFDFSLANVQGNALVVMNSGRILGVNPGLGRVLGLLNIDSIKRRLQLDFSDVTRKGFVFDTLEAPIIFRNGMANTERLLVDGPAAKINLTGTANLQTKGLNLSMYVTPKLMSSSLPIAAGLATGNPAVGLGVWVFDKITNSSLSNITQFQYRITGTWETPSIVETGGGVFRPRG